MTDIVRLNYIITVHNKADLIEQVIWHVLTCCRDYSHIYPVLDGCTDQSEAIIDRVIDANAGLPITKVKTPDVHEIRAINAGLAAAEMEGEGYNIVLQDDVLLADYDLESKVQSLYRWIGPRLGFVSFRLGANFDHDAATSQSPVPFVDLIESAYGHGLADAGMLLPGQFAFRSVCIKSPICIPFSLVRELGPLEEQLAPYMHDDTEYSLRCKKAGYKNGVFGLRFISDIKWGTTRTPKKARELAQLTQRNMDIIRSLYARQIARISEDHQPIEIVDVPRLVNQEERARALHIWEENRERLAAYQNQQRPSMLMRARLFVKQAIQRS